MLNEQAPEKRVISSGDVLAVNSIFHTIQGEGPFAGEPATFVRLAGCNLQCPLCDTEYTKREALTITAITMHIVRVCPNDHKLPTLVVITGGEPFRQSIGPLIERLISIGHKVQVETNGTLFQDGVPFHDPNLTIVCSPKLNRIHKRLMPFVKALKYVGTAESLSDVDGLPNSALNNPTTGPLQRPPVDWTGEVFLQPVDEQDPVANQRNLDAVVQSCMKYGYRLCLQMHKIAGLA